MPESFNLTVLSPTRTLLDEPVESVIAPGSEGYLGILAHHAPLITSLRPGKLTVRDPSGSTAIYAMSGGFLEVSNNRCVILADTLEEPERIDVDRARRAADRARERLKDMSAQIDRERAEAALARARNRVKIASEREGG
jgi:F-type H+-transporting ATPase subunit epsilon